LVGFAETRCLLFSATVLALVLHLAVAMSDTKSSEFKTRTVIQKVLSQEQAEGAGARVRRSIGRPELRNLDPFLMLDRFSVSPPAGFPNHPHRGFETVTYMLKGAFKHEDFCGHKGIIEAGDLQWMTAGKGIVHSEMPATSGENSGLQLWVNLAAKDKMMEPRYQELKAKDIPHVTKDGVTAIVIAGEALGVSAKVQTLTPTHYLHFIMDAKSELRQPIPEGWTSFVYTLSGEARFGSDDAKAAVKPNYTLVLSKEGNGLLVKTGEEKAEFVLISGKPIGEPIVQYGPFVMNTQKEIMQAFQDYQYGRNGFENAAKWQNEADKDEL